MSQGAAAVGPQAGLTYMPEGQMGPTYPGSMAAPSAEQSGLWSSIKGVLGDTAGSFVEMLGDSPEERQQNLEAFTKSIGTINELGKGLSQTSLPQRLGQKRGAEMVQQQQAAAMNPPAMQPLPALTPEMVQGMLQSVGLGVQGIKEATKR